MKYVRYALVFATVVALMLVGAKLVTARSGTTQYYGPGGEISGRVLGFTMFDELRPIAWATITADNGQQTFVTYSGAGGFYYVYVPAGSYNVTVVEPGYTTQSGTVAVSDGPAVINFNLEQSHVPVPEFPTGIIYIIAAVALSAAMVAIRRTKRNR